MRLLFLCICPVFFSWLQAQEDVVVSDVLWRVFSDLRVEDDGIYVTLNSTGLGLAVIQEGELPEAVEAGSMVFIPYGKETIFANRSVSFQFNPVSNTRNFEITRRIDHRSSGGELELFDEFLDAAGAIQGTRFKIVSGEANTENGAVIINGPESNAQSSISVLQSQEPPKLTQDEIKETKKPHFLLLIAAIVGLAILWLAARLWIKKR